MTKYMRIRLSLLVLLAVVLAPVFFALVLGGGLGKLGTDITKMSDEKKLEYIAQDNYRKLGITTIEQFDQFWIDLGTKKRPQVPWTHTVFIVFCFAGLLLLNRIALWVFSLYATYRVLAALAWLMPGVTASTAHLSGRVLQLVIFSIALIFLLRKSMRENFSWGIGPPTTPYTGEQISDS